MMKDFQRATGEERRIVETEIAVHRTLKRLYWMMFWACLMAIGVARVVGRAADLALVWLLG